MKNLLIIFLSSITLISCDPDIPGEGINLPEMEFGIKIHPDTAYIKLGDTINVSASIYNTLSNGVRITDGKAVMDFGCVRFFETPVIDYNKITTCEEEVDFVLFEDFGKVIINSKKIREIHAYPYGDSIVVSFRFIPLKKGTFNFYISSKFFEGSQGKTRTQPYFDMINHNFEDHLWRVDDRKPGDYSYESNYLFAVYE